MSARRQLVYSANGRDALRSAPVLRHGDLGTSARAIHTYQSGPKKCDVSFSTFSLLFHCQTLGTTLDILGATSAHMFLRDANL